ncbi:MAG: hypothetical protein U9R58_09545 [Chloroflexota bacterium]|nr:hypothetical protein [Chloroflexota bacterium]
MEAIKIYPWYVHLLFTMPYPTQGQKMKNCSKSMCMLLILLVLTILISACVLQQTELPFETIEKQKVLSVKEGYESDDYEMFREEEPKLFIITSSDEISAINTFIPPQTRSALGSTDFNTHFIAAVFQGWKPAYDYHANIERIMQSGKAVKVYARFEESGNIVHPMVQSPYHVVRVEKPQEIIGEEVQLILVANGKKIVEELHQVP